MVERLSLPARLAPEEVADDDGATLRAVAEAIDAAATDWLRRTGSGDRLFVTLASADFAPGLLVLLRSLRRHSDVPVLVMQLGSWRLDHEAADVAAIRVPRLVRRGAAANTELPHLATTISKLWTFSLTAPRRAAFLDADCQIVRSIDELFDGDGFAAAPDLLLHYRLRAFNTGVFAFTPSKALRDDLFARLPGLSVADGDQSVLNAYFDAWRQLPLGLNFLRSYALLRSLREDRALRILHHTPGKPWADAPPAPRDHVLAPLDEMWVSELSDAEYRAVKRDWHADTDAVERDLAAWASKQAGPGREEVAAGLARTRRRLAAWLAGLALLSGLQTLLILWLILRG